MELERFKKVGNVHFTQKRYGDAYLSYSDGLALDPSAIDLSSNRAAVSLLLGLWQKALTDTERVLEADPTHDKCIHRKIKALWGLNRYSDALSFYNANAPRVIGITLEKASQLVTQSQGEYDMAQLYTLNREERHEVAEYFGPVEIQPVPGKGRGLLATQEISPGRLLLCCKAFAVAFDVDKDPYGSKDNEDKCFARVLEKLMLDDSLLSQIQDLYGNESQDTPWKQEEWQEGVSNVLKYNGFRCVEITGPEGDGSKNFSGLWILPSYLNHSCISNNAYYQVIGDIMFVRAVKPIRLGEEVTISYWAPTVPTRMRVMAARNFSCDCSSCILELQEKQQGSLVPSQISQLLQQIRLHIHDQEGFEMVQKIVKLRQGQEELNVALLTPEVDAVRISLESREEYEKSVFILEAMHKVCANNCFVRSAVFQSLNLVRSYLQLEDATSVRRWWKVFKTDVVVAYGSFTDGVKLKELNLVEKEVAMYEQLAGDLTAKLQRKR